jgi:ABC-type bacteriocin/lantibiotic exporter with double-glycine peptidase domain
MNNTAMPSKPPFHKQETRYSCVPACLRMVLGSFGLDLTEDDLRARCDCTSLYGTDALKAVEATRQLGFAGTAKYTLSPSELRTLVSIGHYLIVFVDLRPIDGIADNHALVIIGFSPQEVTVLDPISGERMLSLQTFHTAWAMRHNITILIER